ncbi:transmembrane protein, putative [Bodo saltans]|uniref:Transmembrane protein, putative n=1 Tax=Bodo saltans TaxID=75058 RepID=A0A0S4JGS5_BODSA|nr:transmembrane protein, putative [Bodo saltans]|eukprot:CUG89292.1 transmembrane protein, putative [Bodo saltans]
MPHSLTAQQLHNRSNRSPTHNAKLLSLVLQLRSISLVGRKVADLSSALVPDGDHAPPSLISTFVRLKSVTLIHWELSSKLLRAIGELPELEHINLQGEKTRKWIDVQPLLLRAEHLRSLQLPAVSMSRIIGFCSSFSCLQLLSLTSAHIHEHHFAALTSLRHLRLDHCWWHSSSCRALFDRLRGLSHLALSACNLDDDDLAAVSTLGGLVHLELDIPSLNRHATDAGLVHLSALVNLQHFRLKCGSQRRMFFGGREDLIFTDSGTAFLAHLTQLQHLHLSLPYIFSNTMQHVLGMQHLTELHLHCRGMNELFLFRLVELRLLKVLSLGRCRHVTDRVLARWTRLQCLEEVTLSECYGNYTDDLLEVNVHVTPLRLGRRSGVGAMRRFLNWCGLTSLSKHLPYVTLFDMQALWFVFWWWWLRTKASAQYAASPLILRMILELSVFGFLILFPLWNRFGIYIQAAR